MSDITGVLVTGDAGFVGATTVTALAGLCRLAAGRPGHPVEYRQARPGEVGRNFASYGLAHRLLGYSPTVRIEDGIPRLWQWFKSEVFRD